MQCRIQPLNYRCMVLSDAFPEFTECECVDSYSLSNFDRHWLCDCWRFSWIMRMKCVVFLQEVNVINGKLHSSPMSV